MPTSAAASASALLSLVQRIDAALPQTQCTRCGYPDCAAYAQAIAEDTANINQCPPGGAEGVARLSAITGRPAVALNAEHGHEGPLTVAVIDEDWCIGCTLCIKACPTDAILGANKRMHTVIAPHCTGCELCIPVCPVDCIRLDTVSGDRTGWAAWSAAQADHAKERYAARSTRQQRDQEPSIPASPPSVGAAEATSVTVASVDPKQAAIAAAMARARERRLQSGV